MFLKRQKMLQIVRKQLSLIERVLILHVFLAMKQEEKEALQNIWRKYFDVFNQIFSLIKCK